MKGKDQSERKISQPRREGLADDVAVGSLAPICQSSLFYTFGLLKDYMICLAGSRSDLIPVPAVQVSVEATGELAAQRYEYRQLKATWLHEDPTDKPSSNPWKNWRFPRL